MRVEKRIPFGFKGVWGKVYKLYTFDIKAEGVIVWQGNNYRAVDGKLQFKELSDNTSKTFTQAVSNLITDSTHKTVATTDAYYNSEKQTYSCVVGMGDIIHIGGQYWAVDTINEQSVYTPQKHSVWYIGLKEIFEEILPKEY